MTVSLTHAVAVAVEKFADCGPGKWWFVHHPDGFLIECALQQRAEQIAAEINAGRSTSPDKFCVQASADRDAGHMPTCALTPRDDLTVGTDSPEREPGNPEVCAISPMRSHSGDSRPAAHDPLKSYATSPAGESIQRERKPMRPLCQRPGMCGGYGRKHCGPCERAAGVAA
ncbi:hypothetical protein PZ895_07870 [Mesorhizobium sp. YIM 152430]|uniref:hypothetical protein n=1 Tax=Mesorhizobium sp. YIM 152430 TaxID=3031761 RepID=UPI0023DCE3E3|nr:hypothetical protein [Mesorhizobium sp. YIM 152430]MDF1599692.1 hypothetical protein [Mesorhizobium sp. YIM 152430]